MNLRMGSQTFLDVTVPVLWGARAILAHKGGKLSAVDLSGPRARLEILADKPAPGVDFRPVVGAFVILDQGRELYSYSPANKRFESISLDLPSCQIEDTEILIGTTRFASNIVRGSAVGIQVTKDAIMMGVSRLPPGLAALTL